MRQELCGHDRDAVTLTTQLEPLKVTFASDSQEVHSIKEITETVKTFLINFQEYFF